MTTPTVSETRILHDLADSDSTFAYMLRRYVADPSTLEGESADALDECRGCALARLDTPIYARDPILTAFVADVTREFLYR